MDALLRLLVYVVPGRGLAVLQRGVHPLARPRIEADIEYAMGRYGQSFSLPRPKLGLKIIKNLHNAFFVSGENAYDAPAAVQYTPDVTYHEVAHAFIENVGKLGYGGETGSIIESYADACASWISQQKLGQTAQTAHWTVGAGAIAALFGTGDPRQDRTALRSLKAPGTASRYDSQVGDYKKLPPDRGNSQVALGVPNEAFYETAVRIGADRAIKIWIAAIPAPRPGARIPDLVLAAIAAARATQRAADAVKVGEAWAAVGLPEADALADVGQDCRAATAAPRRPARSQYR